MGIATENVLVGTHGEFWLNGSGLPLGIATQNSSIWCFSFYLAKWQWTPVGDCDYLDATCESLSSKRLNGSGLPLGIATVEHIALSTLV